MFCYCFDCEFIHAARMQNARRGNETFGKAVPVPETSHEKRSGGEKSNAIFLSHLCFTFFMFLGRSLRSDVFLSFLSLNEEKIFFPPHLSFTSV